MKAVLSSLCMMASSVNAAGYNMPRLVAEFDLKNAAVASVSPKLGQFGPSLLISTFYPSGTDGVFAVTDVNKLLTDNTSAKVRQIENITQWPNMAEATGDGQKVLTACGFFVSGAKSTGSIDIFDVSHFPFGVGHTKVSEDRKGNFYHHAIWMDVDGDGDDDIVAARSYKALINPFSKPEGELLWFKKQADGSYATHFLTQAQGLGPGVAFIPTDLNGDGKTEFVAAQFFTAQQLSIWECTMGSTWDKCENGEGVKTYVVDNENNTPFFNVQWVDLNGDGKKDLLATTNTANGSGAVYAFELVGDFRDGPSAWTKHVLATGYKPLKPYLPGQGSPGNAIAFELQDGKGEKPAILVSADDGGWFDILFPSSQEASTWTYSKNRLVTSTGTVGSMSTPVDIDGSGKKVFFAPLFSVGKVQMYQF